MMISARSGMMRNFEAWRTGQTGFPMVDACMRSVNATGYLNFRMRAMLVSFLTHHLWLDWPKGSLHLAKQFLDFEPGIHYSQFQMQASTMGVNTIRIYNPVKQGYDHDPDGTFIREWVDELKGVPTELIHEPWKMSGMEQEMYECRIGVDYPEPIIPDIKESYKHASSVLWSKKGSKEVKK
ncbi:MAG: FAD-binding domain-containing protein [Rhodohalobacter sp.]|nr:FAD-binding domain-containing protein [Rhodohalobacter sp.]